MMEKAKKILYISQEVEPYIADSEFAVLNRNLIQGVQEFGREVRVFMPKWGPINERRNQLHEVIRLSGMNLIIDDTDHQLIIKVASILATRLQIYFIDNDDYMKNRLFFLNKDGRPYKDNVERVMFFARGTLETVKKLRWVPEVIHCTGIMSALAPYLLKLAYYDEPSFRESRIIFTPTRVSEAEDVALPRNFAGVIRYREANRDAVATLGRMVSFSDLNRIGMFLSDGVVLREHDEAFERMAREMGKPYVVIDEGDAAKTPIGLYDQLWHEAVMKRPKKEDDDDDFLF